METKQITYRGGIVSFRLPGHWREEYDPQGGATFYEDRSDSGTLRLAALGFSSDGKVPAAQMSATAFPGSDQTTHEGWPMRREIKHADEDGEALTLVCWEVAVPIPPDGVRIVCFTHTILRGQEEEPAIASELQQVNRLVLDAVYSQQQGIAEME